jgi:phosphoenolpyruvate synthase/pyruvate phosphate dikinase
MELIRPFEQLGKGDAGFAGGKGASLGEMTQAGIPVPPGFVILADAFEKFLEEADLNQELDTILHTVNREEMRTVDLASEKIQQLILAAQMPEDIASEIVAQFKKLDAEYVAVRSSATAEDSSSAAWAGQLDTFLNTTEDSLLQNVQRCWASLFTPRAIFYRFEKGMHGTKISVAVVVQKMVQSEVSGIAFSVHPVTEDYNQMIIEAGFGLGEAIVSGQVTPDSYVIEKVPRRIIDKNITYQSKVLIRGKEGGNEWRELSETEGNKPALSDEQSMQLAEIVLRIENHYDFPCDIEWAFEAGNFYITQSRPITTLSAHVVESQEKMLRDAGFFEKDLWEEQGKWTQPLITCSFFVQWHTSSVMKRVVPEMIFHPLLSIAGHDLLYRKDVETLYELLKKTYNEERLKELVERIDIEGKSAEKALMMVLENSDDYLLAHGDEFIARFHDVSAFWMLVGGAMGDLVLKLALDVGYVQKDAELFERVQPFLRTTWLEDEVSNMRSIAEHAVARFGRDPHVVAQHISDPEVGSAIDQYVRDFAWLTVFKWAGGPIDREYGDKRFKEEVLNCISGNYIETKKAPESQADQLVTLATATAYWRAECGRIDLVVGLRIQSVLKKLAERSGVSVGDFRMMTPSELASVFRANAFTEPVGFRARAKEYITGFAATGEQIVLTPDNPLYKKIFDTHIFSGKVVSTDELRGTGACPGKVTGIVRIIESPDEFGQFNDGEILVAAETTPSFVPLMRKASAILTGRGGITSHAAIVSRELKKPCVIAIKNVTEILKDGDMVEVDADNGVVRKVNLATKNQEISDPIVLLGAWNTRPLEVFHWLDSDATDHFYELTGVRVRTFSYIADQLHYQCVFEREFMQLKADFEKQGSEDARITYAAKIYDDFQTRVTALETYLAEMKTKDPTSLSNVELAQSVLKFADVWTPVVMQVWYAAFLDMWYPNQEDHMKVKAVAAKARDHAGHLHAESNLIEKKIYAEAAKRLSLPDGAIDYLFPSEIYEALTKGTHFKDEAARRAEFCVTESLDGEYKIHSDQAAHELFDRYKPPSLGVDPKDVLTGIPANKGKIKGTARVIRFDKEFVDFQKGEILVAPQTMVHYLPIMKKSSAILTEFGGLTSHAAIVSRELGKPVIVGIQNLIASVHTGDMLEVDADNGIVRKI